MADYALIVIVATLVFVILAQAVERFFYGQSMQEERSKLLAAILSKNASEYAHVVKSEKEPVVKPATDTDEIDLSNADDETFDKFIERQAE